MTANAAWLRVRNPVSGLRDFDDICALATRTGFVLVASHSLPANIACWSGAGLEPKLILPGRSSVAQQPMMSGDGGCGSRPR